MGINSLLLIVALVLIIGIIKVGLDYDSTGKFNLLGFLFTLALSGAFVELYRIERN
ncbi:MAG: hypothetical protein J1F31_01850 [Erysipelotrichales bacterium]|nr:hypothetical protein [Erysipelotrichales bacterium]